MHVQLDSQCVQLARIDVSVGPDAYLVGQDTCFYCTYTSGFLKCSLTNIQYMWGTMHVLVWLACMLSCQNIGSVGWDACSVAHL